MSQIAIITDTHFGIKNDAKFMLDYQEEFYKNVFFPYLINNNIKTLFHLGDLFDRRKYVNFVTLNRTKEMFLNLLRDYQITMYIIPGNHDVYFKNTNMVNSLNELLGEYDNIDVIEECADIAIDGVTFSFIPWINQENYAQTLSWIDARKTKDILCGHLELQGFEMYAGVRNDHGMDTSIFSGWNEVWSGHFHHKSESDNIRYLGAPMEFTFADAADARGFHTFDTSTRKLTFHRNPYILYHKIYYNDEIESNQKYFREVDTSQFTNKIVKVFVIRKTKPAIFDFFIEKLYKESTIDLTVVEDYSEFYEGNIEDFDIKEKSTKELMDKYVDGIETDMDKSRLKNILNGLYIEALHSEKF